MTAVRSPIPGAFLAALLLAAPLTSRADEPVHFQIAAQPLVPALKAFAEQANMQLLYKHDVVERATANAVMGDFGRRSALEQLLRGTGLEIVFTAEDAATIRAKGPGSTRSSAAAGLDAFRLARAEGSEDAARDQAAQNAEIPGGSAPAQEGDDSDLEEVVVTSRFREETVQGIGASIGVVSGRDIESAGLADFQDIATHSVGISLTDRGPNQNDVSIRGVSNSVDEGLTDGGAGTPLVTQYLDDIPVSSPTASQKDFNLFDVARIEVIRGPQPTYFGEGSMGGTIRYFSQNPDLDGERVDAGALRAAVSSTRAGGTSYRIDNSLTFNMVPGVLGARVTGSYRDDAGFIDNPMLGTKDINDYRTYGGRAVVLYRPTSQLSARFVAHLGRDEQGDASSVDFTGRRKELTFRAGAPGATTDDFELFSGRLDYDFGRAKLTSISGYYERRRDQRIYDALNSVYFESVLGIPFPLLAKNDGREANFTQELRFVTSFESAVNFTGGLFYGDSKFDINGSIGGPGFAVVTEPPSEDGLISDTTYRTEQLSGFGEVTWSVTDRVRLIGGARYVHQKSISTLHEYVSIGGLEPPIPFFDYLPLFADIGQPTRFEFKLHRTLPRAAVEWDAGSDVMLYASVAKGVRSGNLNNAVAAFQVATVSGSFDEAAFLNALTYDEDKVLSFEAGAKTRWLGGGLTLNTAVFHTKYENPHVAVLVPFILIDNGPDARINGLELEGRWRAGPRLSFSFSGSYTDAQFTKSALLIPPVPELPELRYDVLKGNTLKNVPKYTASLGGDFSTPIGGNGLAFTAHADLAYVGKRYSSVQNIASGILGSMSLLNLRAGVERGAWSVMAFVNNALDDIEYQELEGITAAPFLTPDGKLDYPITTASANRPRTLGIEFRVRY